MLFKILSILKPLSQSRTRTSFFCPELMADVAIFNTKSVLLHGPDISTNLPDMSQLGIPWFKQQNMGGLILENSTSPPHGFGTVMTQVILYGSKMLRILNIC